MNFGEYALRWVEERDLAATTDELYRRLLRLHLLPTFDGVDLDKITPPGVRTWRAERLKATEAPTTVAKSYRLLKAIMETAVDDELIRRNPCRIKGAGKESAEERARGARKGVRWCVGGARRLGRSRQRRTPRPMTWGFVEERVTRIELAL